MPSRDGAVPWCRALPVLLSMHSGCSQLEAVDSIEEWVSTSTLTGCDYAYRVSETPWEEEPGEGWPSPQAALDEATTMHAEIVWSSESVNPSAELDVVPAPWLAALDTWTIQLTPHETRLPLIADNSWGPIECPDLLVVPVGARVETDDGQLVLESLGRGLRPSWKGSSFPPWAAIEVSAIVLRQSAQASLGLNILPAAEDRFEWSENLANQAGLNIPSGFEQGALRIQTAGGLEAGHAALSATFVERDGGTINRGLGWGLYRSQVVSK